MGLYCVFLCLARQQMNYGIHGLRDIFISKRKNYLLHLVELFLSNDYIFISNLMSYTIIHKHSYSKIHLEMNHKEADEKRKQEMNKKKMNTTKLIQLIYKKHIHNIITINI